MRSSTETLSTDDGTELFVYRWEPDAETTARAVVQIAHGMAEHAARYERFAQRLTGAGFVVFAPDHRGHGRTAGSLEHVGYFADRDGWNRVVGDLVTVTRRAQAEHPGLPVFLYGHSMGSILARAYAIDHGDQLAGLLLSGAGGDPGLLGRVGALIAAAECRIRGRRARSGLLDTLTFGRFNDAFKPTRTAFDWLSRDEAEVDRYIDDPWCGGTFTAGFFADLLHGVAAVNSPAAIRKVPKNLPVYLFSGEKDPVGANTKGVLQAVEQYRSAGVEDVTVRFYPDARHEVLNETNRDEVQDDVVAWLEAHLVDRSAPSTGDGEPRQDSPST